MMDLSKAAAPLLDCPGSQHHEDKILRELLQPEKRRGTYVDVGAYHHSECSNTWELYNLGWRGLLIDPLPTTWVNLLMNRTGDYLYPSAVSDKEGTAELRVAGGESSVDEYWAIESSGTVVVKTETLMSILDKFPAIRDDCDLCSIDVEGSEINVLKGTDLSIFHPKVILIEFRIHDYEKLGKSRANALRGFLCGRYEEVDRTDLNLIFVRSDLR